MDLALDNALMNVLCYFAPPCQAASQEARGLASDARLEPPGMRTLVRRIVILLDEYDWNDVRSREVLRVWLKECKPVTRRAKKKPMPRRIRKET